MRTYEYTVPPGVELVEIILCGGDGGSAADGTPGEHGETLWYTKRVVPGQVLTARLGEGGKGAPGAEDGEDAMIYIWAVEE